MRRLEHVTFHMTQSLSWRSDRLTLEINQTVTHGVVVGSENSSIQGVTNRLGWLYIFGFNGKFWTISSVHVGIEVDSCLTWFVFTQWWLATKIAKIGKKYSWICFQTWYIIRKHTASPTLVLYPVYYETYFNV